MKLKIYKDRTIVALGTWGTVNENNYEILEFEFPAELENYNKRIVYYLGDERVWDAIVDNKAYITNAVTTHEKVKAYVWCTETDEEIEKDIDFRTKLFEMNFYENKNADGIVPTEEQVDGFNTILTAMNRKISEVNILERTIEEAEDARVLAEQNRETRTNQAISNIVDMTNTYNENATQKITEFNSNAVNKTNDFNANVTEKINTLNQNAIDKTNDFNTNVTNKTEDFNDNADNRKAELQAISDTARDFVGAVTFTTLEQNFDTGCLEVNGEESLGNLGFGFDYEKGNLEVEING